MHAEALVIYGNNGPVHEMRYSEFTALLDGVVTAPDFAGQQAEAVYVQLDGRLQIIAMVFFRLPFDRAGHVDPQWNLPLQTLADKATLGPPMGGNKTTLMCRSQCPQKWHAHLWEPKARQGRDPFDDLYTRLVRRNKLRLMPELEVLEVQPDPSEHFEMVEQEWARKVGVLEQDLAKAQQTIGELKLTNNKLRAYIKTLKAHYIKLKSVHEGRRSA